jgi:hypothetical protein
MTDNQTPQGPRDIYRAYVADWDRYISPADQQSAEYARLSVEYGKLVLQSSFILNGGAIVAVAPLIQGSSSIDIVGLAFSAFWFVTGIGCTALSSALA